MKRIFILLLALLVLSSFVACGAIEPPASATEAPAEGATEGLTEIPVETQAPAPVEFQEQLVVDNDACTIKIIGIEPDNFLGYTVNLYLENKSPDTTYMFSLDESAINGVQKTALFAAEVSPGKKANESINFYDLDEDVNIGAYSDIELSFRVYDSNDWLADSVAEVTTHLYPLGQENAAAYVRPTQSTDIVLADNDQVSVIATGYRTDDIWGYCVDLFLVNKSDMSVMFSVDEASVNGFMADPFYATSVAPGKCAFSSLSWSSSSLEENGITAVESIEFLLRAYNADDIFADDLVNETITLTP